MKISKGKIIAALFVVYLIVIGIKVVGKRKESNAQILKDVTVVQNGKLESENDGKLVLVSGKLEVENFLQLPELTNPIATFKVERSVKEYTKTTDEKGENHYDWEDRTAPKAYPSNLLDTLVTETVTVPVKLGDFTIDKTGVSKLKARDNFLNFDIPSIQGLEFDGLRYTNPAHKDNEYVGDVALDYRYYNLEKYPEVSILARQSGSTFVPYVMDKNEIYEVWTEKVDSVSALNKKLQEQVESDKKSRIIFIVIFVAFVALLTLSSKKGGKAKTGTDEAGVTVDPKAEETPASKMAVSEEAEATAGANEEPEEADSTFADDDDSDDISL